MGKLLPTVGIEGRLSSLKQVLEPVDYLAEEIGYLPEEVLALPGLLFAAFGAYAVVTVVMSGGSYFALSLYGFAADIADDTVGKSVFGAGGSLAGSCIIGFFSRFEEAEECIEVAVYGFVEKSGKCHENPPLFALSVVYITGSVFCRLCTSFAENAGKGFFVR